MKYKNSEIPFQTISHLEPLSERINFLRNSIPFPSIQNLGMGYSENNENRSIQVYSEEFFRTGISMATLLQILFGRASFLCLPTAAV
jgi:hypothetical protein